MKIEFKQKRGPNSRSFILTDDRVFVETKTLERVDKYELKLDQLGMELHYQADNTISGKITFGIAMVVTVGSLIAFFAQGDKQYLLISILFGLIAAIAYFKKHNDDIFLVGGQANLVFFRTTPNEKAVLDFIDIVRLQIKAYLRMKYCSYDSTTSIEDFYHRINWLLNKEVIDQQEYIELKAKFDLYKLL